MATFVNVATSVLVLKFFFYSWTKEANARTFHAWFSYSGNVIDRDGNGYSTGKVPFFISAFVKHNCILVGNKH